MMRRICIFCGSSLGASPEYAEAARDLGRLLGERGIGLVYGGGNVGLMGVVAEATLQAGGEVDGVIPRALVARELAHRGLTRLHIVGSMHERKQLMHELSDAFITLPGGFGTLDELFETLTWAQLGVHDKPCGLLDVMDKNGRGFYGPLLELIDQAVAARFVRPEHRALVIVERSGQALLERFAAYVPPQVRKWIDRGEV